MKYGENDKQNELNGEGKAGRQVGRREENEKSEKEVEGLRSKRSTSQSYGGS